MVAVFLALSPNSSLISLAIPPVTTIETVLLAIATFTKPTSAPIPICAERFVFTRFLI